MWVSPLAACQSALCFPVVEPQLQDISVPNSSKQPAATNHLHTYPLPHGPVAPPPGLKARDPLIYRQSFSSSSKTDTCFSTPQSVIRRHITQQRTKNYPTHSASRTLRAVSACVCPANFCSACLVSTSQSVNCYKGSSTRPRPRQLPSDHVRLIPIHLSTDNAPS